MKLQPIYRVSYLQQLIFIFLFCSCNSSKIIVPAFKGRENIIQVKHENNYFITDIKTFSEFFPVQIFGNYFKRESWNDTLMFTLFSLRETADSTAFLDMDNRFGQFLQTENYWAFDSNLVQIDKIKLERIRMRKAIHRILSNFILSI